MRKFSTRGGVIVALAAAAAMALPSLASAAPTASNSTQVTLGAGTLQLLTAPTVPSLSGSITGATQTLSTKLTNWEVNDATGSGSGWNLSEQAEGLLTETAGSYVFPASSLVYNSTGDSAITGQNGTTGTAPTAQCSSGCALDNLSPKEIAHAAVGAGLGTWQSATAAGDVALTVPANANAGTYTATLDWNLASGV